MKYNRCIAIIVVVFLIAVSGLATADVLPKQRPENQKLSINSDVEILGPVSKDLSVVWQVGDAGLSELPKARQKDGGLHSGSIAYATYSDFIMSNGGQISEVMSFSMDTHAKTEGLYNIETAKVLTYTSQNGSHLMGEESYVLDVAGNWSYGPGGDIICVFAKASPENIVPAFCSKVSALSKLRSVNTAQIESIGSLTAVGKTSDVPAALNYAISVVPDANSASGYADGIISTTFTVSIMEGRNDGPISTLLGDPNFPMYLQCGAQYCPPSGPGVSYDLGDYDKLASTLTFIDTATLAGGISNFTKVFNYQSGVACTNCN